MIKFYKTFVINSLSFKGNRISIYRYPNFNKNPKKKEHKELKEKI